MGFFFSWGEEWSRGEDGNGSYLSPPSPVASEANQQFGELVEERGEIVWRMHVGAGAHTMG